MVGVTPREKRARSGADFRRRRQPIQASIPTGILGGVARHLPCSLLLVVILFATSCGGDRSSSESSDNGQISTTSGVISEVARDSERCDAFRGLASAQPPAGSLGPEQWKAAYDGYADAAERAAAVGPADDAEVLMELAAVMRIIADDPADPDIAGRVQRLGDPIHDLAVEADDACGVTFGVGFG